MLILLKFVFVSEIFKANGVPRKSRINETASRNFGNKTNCTDCTCFFFSFFMFGRNNEKNNNENLISENLLERKSVIETWNKHESHFQFLFSHTCDKNCICRCSLFVNFNINKSKRCSLQYLNHAVYVTKCTSMCLEKS